MLDFSPPPVAPGAQFSFIHPGGPPVQAEVIEIEKLFGEWHIVAKNLDNPSAPHFVVVYGASNLVFA